MSDRNGNNGDINSVHWGDRVSAALRYHSCLCPRQSPNRLLLLAVHTVVDGEAYHPVPLCSAMNSLTYLSRQFDVLASPRTAPSTPTSELPPSLPRRSSSTIDTSARNRPPTTWSIKLLVAPPPQPRRAISSARIPTRRQSSRSIRAKQPQQPQGVLRRLFFVRLFVLLWHAVCDTAAALQIRIREWHGPGGAVGVVDTLAVDEGEKESDDEDRSEEDALVLQPVQSNSSLRSASPPSLASSSSSRNSLHPPVHRSHTDPPPNPSSSLRSQSQAHSQTLLPQPLIPSLLLTPSPSRTPTPTLIPPTGLPVTPRKSPFHLPKTLVLDLDETLIHSTSRPLHGTGAGGSGLLSLGGFGFGRNKSAGHMVEVVLGGRSTLYHVYKRPFVDFFLRKVSGFERRATGECCGSRSD